MKSVEQECRDLLERIGVEGAQNFSAGELVELANVVAEVRSLREKLAEHHKANGQLVQQLRECRAGIEGGQLGQGSGNSAKPHSVSQIEAEHNRPSDLNPSDPSISVFTRKDVAGLRERAANSRDSYRHAQDNMSTRIMHDARRAYELFESLADRIERLLPPE